MIAIIDYGVGNLFSLKSSFEAIGADITVTNDENIIKNAEKIVLPGVGAFEDAVRKLRESGLDKVIISETLAGKKLFGICLGMQMLFERSFEYGEHSGLDLIKGSVVPMQPLLPSELKVPHIGWNELKVCATHPIFKYTQDGDFVYFVHSYYAIGCDESLLATTEYGKDITAAVAYKNITGMQFHPEKSGEAGLSILRAFVEWSD